MNLKKIVATLLFLVSLLFFYKYVGVHKDIHKRPCSVHSWAQCERASIALNYYQLDMNFFKPRIHKLHDGDGITGLEFPFVNYSVAILYKLFGFNEFYYRLFVMLTMVFGLIMFNLLSFSITKNYLLSLITVGFAYFSPILIYYTANFLPDTTSLGFVLAAWYFFFNYLSSGRNKQLWLFFSFALIAALVKITSIIVFGVVIGLVILDYFRFFHKTRQNIPLFSRKASLLVLSLLCMGLVFAWYRYAQWLSETYFSDAFLLHQNLVRTKKEALDIWEAVKLNWVPHYYSNVTYMSFLWVAGSFIVFCKYVSRLLFVITFITFAGSCCFVYLMLVQFRNHDYYIIALLPSVFFFFLTFADLITRLADNFFPPLKFLVVLIFCFYSVECIQRCRESYSVRFDASSYSYTGDFRAYEDLEPKLRQLGIDKKDITLNGFDNTYCNGLYLMNQAGWNFGMDATPEYVAWLVNTKNIRYLILNDSSGFNKLYPNDFGNKIIGYHRGLFIYKLK